jgi:proton-translocating NAD(P)+ transhydrogenase subunit alpha
VVEHGVTVIGATDLASRLCAHASQMYSRNMEKLFFHLTKDGAWRLDFSDDIVAGSVVTHGGDIVHPKLQDLGAPDATARSAGAAR